MGILDWMFLILFTLKILGLVQYSWWVIWSPIIATFILAIPTMFIKGEDDDD